MRDAEPVPARRPSAAAVEFVGREEELALLRLRLDQACTGAGGVALLVGEPGIGKTRTAEELAADAGLRGARVLWGRCYEGEGAPAFWPWAQLLRAYARGRDPEALRAELGRAAPEVAQLVPEIREHLPDLPEPAPLEAARARFRLFDGVTGFLKAAAERQPLLLVLDDLHWADRASLLLLRFLAGEVRASRLLVLATYRDLEVGRKHPLAQTLAELAREPTSQRIPLRGLDEHDLARFIELAVGLEPPAALVAAIARETAGNPFFVAELVRVLLAEGRLGEPAPPGAWSLTVPQTVRDVIGRRLERLSARCNRVLAVAAVIGREFGLAVLGPASQFAPGALLGALAEAEAARVIAALPGPPGRYAFGHALIRETLYEELPVAGRARLHRQVGEALETWCAQDPEPHLAELAHHFLQAASAGAAAKAVAYGRRAGERASALLAYDEAAGHYERALQAAELQGSRTLREQCELLLALGDAQRKAGEPRSAMETFQRSDELARKVGDPELQAVAALDFEDAVLPAGVPRAGPRDPSVRLLEEAMRALGDRDSPLRVRVLAALARALVFAGSPDRAAALSRQAVEVARRLSEPSALVYALTARRTAVWGPDHLEERLALAGEIVSLARELGNRETALDGHHWRLCALLEHGDVRAADAELAAYAQLAEELRQPAYLWYPAVFRATRALLHGRFQDAEQLISQGLAEGQRAQSENAAQVCTAQLFVLRREQGRLGELEEPLETLAEQFGPRRPAGSALALLRCELGREAEARRHFEWLAAQDFAELPNDHGWLISAALLSEVCASLGDSARAATLYEQLLPYAGQHVLATSAGPSWGSAARYLALLAATMGKWEEAAGHFEAALASQARTQALAWLARTRYDFARLLLVRGKHPDRERASGLLVAALEAAHQIGMPRLVEQVAALQAAEAQGQVTPAYPDGLTGREVEVLRLIAAGHTTREIAAELVVTVGTVERHITNLYGKIGARGRADATAYALEHGLARPRHS